MTSTIKVNTIQNTCGADIIKESSNTITIGASGDTVTLASGASQSGFGRTGTVDWQTGSIKTSTFTAANGEGYFADTSSGGFTMNLPAGSAGAIVSVQDYNNTFDSNALTIQPNGTEKINGGDGGGILKLTTEGEGLTLVYIDSTVGWRSIQDSDFATQSSNALIATGGTVTCSGNFKIHTFTGPGTFTVTQASTTAANNIVSYMVVAGGGGGGDGDVSGAGGAGGFREYKGPADCYTASPLNGNPGGTAVTVTAQAYPITVGGGGAAGCGNANGVNGTNSIFSTITSAGGGGGANGASGPAKTAGSGGSGGGKNWDNGTAGSGNTPPVNPPQGNPGGDNAGPSVGPAYGAGGGGGATAAGGNGSPSAGGSGGAGATTSISASPTAYAGGGGGARNDSVQGGAGGSGGGGAGGGSGVAAGNGTDNTGGGGGGKDNCSPGGGAGGSGVVVIRYKFQG